MVGRLGERQSWAAYESEFSLRHPSLSGRVLGVRWWANVGRGRGGRRRREGGEGKGEGKTHRLQDWTGAGILGRWGRGTGLSPSNKECRNRCGLVTTVIPT